MTNAFQAVMLEAPLEAGRIATVRDGIPIRMLTRRILNTRSHAEVFDDMAYAEAWLFAA